MPVSTFSCFQKAEIFPRRISPSKIVATGRACCERVDNAALNIIFDMFNALPAAAQLNQYRLTTLSAKLATPNCTKVSGLNVKPKT